MEAKKPDIEKCLEVVATLEARTVLVRFVVNFGDTALRMMPIPHTAFKANNGSSKRSGVKLGGDNTRSLQARRLLQGYGFDGYMIKKRPDVQ
ncbi:hypothetical protein Bca52824_052664 [Brassica carinata]|uniref:Uncharacterized protein n=1 Tax=Brassica carinata TaxID=52824 RepID=A0A8X7UK57_BRACI|nr:hypothetical protein Bca52824_052664 [Brassica carinata]